MAGTRNSGTAHNGRTAAGTGAAGAAWRPPAVDALLRLPGVQPLVAEHGHGLVTAVIRALLAGMRQQMAGPAGRG